MKIYDNMKAMSLALMMAAALMSASFATAQEPEKKPDIYEQAEMEADRLQKVLDLEDWQVFYVDSTLTHDLPAMRAEIHSLATQKVGNSDMYQMVQDKWMDQIDATYKKIFTEQQWAAYLKSGAARAQKARAKRQTAKK